MERQGFNLQLTRYDARGWRATFYMSGDGALANGCDRDRLGADAVVRSVAGAWEALAIDSLLPSTIPTPIRNRAADRACARNQPEPPMDDKGLNAVGDRFGRALRRMAALLGGCYSKRDLELLGWV